MANFLNSDTFTGKITAQAANLTYPGGTANTAGLTVTAGSQDPIQGNYVQMAFQYLAGGYAHNIRTTHQSSGPPGNQFQFYLWQPSDGVNNLGSYRAMDITNSGLNVYGSYAKVTVGDSNNYFGQQIAGTQTRLVAAQDNQVVYSNYFTLSSGQIVLRSTSNNGQGYVEVYGPRNGGGVFASHTISYAPSRNITKPFVLTSVDANGSQNASFYDGSYVVDEVYNNRNGLTSSGVFAPSGNIFFNAHPSFALWGRGSSLTADQRQVFGSISAGLYAFSDAQVSLTGGLSVRPDTITYTITGATGTTTRIYGFRYYYAMADSGNNATTAFMVVPVRNGQATWTASNYVTLTFGNYARQGEVWEYVGGTYLNGILAGGNWTARVNLDQAETSWSDTGQAGGATTGVTTSLYRPNKTRLVLGSFYTQDPNTSTFVIYGTSMYEAVFDNMVSLGAQATASIQSEIVNFGPRVDIGSNFQIVSPTITLTTNGTAGTTSRVYAVAVLSASGVRYPGFATTITTSAATLTTTNSVNIRWPRDYNGRALVTQTELYRSDDAGTTWKLLYQWTGSRLGDSTAGYVDDGTSTPVSNGVNPITVRNGSNSGLTVRASPYTSGGNAFSIYTEDGSSTAQNNSYANTLSMQITNKGDQIYLGNQNSLVDIASGTTTQTRLGNSGSSTSQILIGQNTAGLIFIGVNSTAQTSIGYNSSGGVDIAASSRAVLNLGNNMTAGNIQIGGNMSAATQGIFIGTGTTPSVQMGDTPTNVQIGGGGAGSLNLFNFASGYIQIGKGNSGAINLAEGATGPIYIANGATGTLQVGGGGKVTTMAFYPANFNIYGSGALSIETTSTIAVGTSTATSVTIGSTNTTGGVKIGQQSAGVVEVGSFASGIVRLGNNSTAGVEVGVSASSVQVGGSSVTLGSATNTVKLAGKTTFGSNTATLPAALAAAPASYTQTYAQSQTDLLNAIRAALISAGITV